MKKTSKKLSIQKETVAALSDAELMNAIGGTCSLPPPRTNRLVHGDCYLIPIKF
jgi:hypothetical protein